MTNFSPAQNRLIQDLHAHFGIEAKDVSLDESGELFFSYDALNLLTIKLAPDIQALSLSCHSFESELGIVSSHASATLTDSRHRSCVKSAQIGEAIPGGTIETLIQAANIADSRAARAVLRAVGFDPVREFQAYLHDRVQVTERARQLAELSQAEKDRRFIHKVRDDLDMDDPTYRTHLSIATLRQHTSTEGLDELNLSKIATYFRALEAAQQIAARKAA